MAGVRTSTCLGLALLLGATAVGCKKDEAKKDDKKAAAGDEQPSEPTLQVATGEEEVDGPVPPETSMVFFVTEGALLPLGCFDAKTKKVRGGKDCLGLVPADAEIRVSSGDTALNKKAGERVEPQCLTGSGQKVALAAEGLGAGANFKFGAWPPSALKVVTLVGDNTIRTENSSLADDEKQKLTAAMKKAGGPSGDIKVHQVAKLDVDGNDKPDWVYAIYVPHPTLNEQYAWSGAFLGLDDNLDAPILLEQSKTKRDVFEVRGLLDLDGDGMRELWMHMTFEEGGGDRLVRVEGNRARPVDGWSCGAS